MTIHKNYSFFFVDKRFEISNLITDIDDILREADFLEQDILQK